jgi:hypothetical protein
LAADFATGLATGLAAVFTSTFATGLVASFATGLAATFALALIFFVAVGLEEDTEAFEGAVFLAGIEAVLLAALRGFWGVALALDLVIGLVATFLATVFFAEFLVAAALVAGFLVGMFNP